MFCLRFLWAFNPRPVARLNYFVFFLRTESEERGGGGVGMLEYTNQPTMFGNPESQVYFHCCDTSQSRVFDFCFNSV